MAGAFLSPLSVSNDSLTCSAKTHNGLKEPFSAMKKKFLREKLLDTLNRLGVSFRSVSKLVVSPLAYRHESVGNFFELVFYYFPGA